MSVATETGAPDAAPAEALGPRPKVGLATKALYSAGSVAFGIKVAALNSMLLLFLNQVAGLPPAQVGFLLMFTTVLDAFLDPVVGQWSDTTRSRFGRRHGFMYVAALPSAVAFFLLWNPPYDWPKEQLFYYMAVLVIALRFLTSLYEVPNAALAPELAPDYDERTKLLAWRWMFGAVGTFVMTLLVYMVLLAPTEEQPVGLLNKQGYSAYGLIAGITIFVSILLSVSGTQRFIPWLNKPAPTRFTFVETAREVLETLKNRNFLVMVISALVGAISTGLSSGLILYINTYFWQFSAQSVGLIVASGVFSTFAAFITAPAIAARFGKRDSCVGLFLFAWLFANTPAILGLLGLTPPPGTQALFLILITFQFIAGVFGTGGFIIASSMIADVVEESQVQTGRRSEGLLMSADTVLQKSVSGLGLFLSGLILAVIHFPDNAVPGQVDPAITRNLLIYSLPVTATMSLISILLLRFYRIDRAAHEANLAKVGITTDTPS